MSDHDWQDGSTLAALQPAVSKELHYRDYKNRLRLQGSQFMALKRPSRLIESSRDYMHGDPVNLIDWKVYARSDRLIIREVRDESATQVRIGVDLSATMWWPTADTPTAPLPCKAEIAMRIALHLAYAHLRMGDMVELCWVNDDNAKIPNQSSRPRRPAAVQTRFNELNRLGFAAQNWFGGDSAEIATSTPDVIFWLGDGLGQVDVKSFLAGPRRSFFIHTLSSLELRTDWLEDEIAYFDKSVLQKEYQGFVLKQQEQYLDQVHAWCHGWRDHQRRHGAHYLTVSDTTAISTYQAAINDFIKVTRRL